MTDTILITAVIVVGFCYLCMGLYARHERKRTVLAIQALTRACEAADSFDAWRIARPFLFVGQSPYAQALVLEVIEQYELGCKLSLCLKRKQSVVDGWRSLLDEMPPDYDPPDEAPNSGPFLFALAHI